MKKDKHLIITTGSKVGAFPFDRLIYIKREGTKVLLATDLSQIEVSQKIAFIEGCLDNRFLTCLKGLIINMDRVLVMTDGLITFDTGESIKIGRDNFRKAKNFYAKYIASIYEKI